MRHRKDRGGMQKRQGRENTACEESESQGEEIHRSGDVRESKKISLEGKAWCVEQLQEKYIFIVAGLPFPKTEEECLYRKRRKQG